MSGEAFSVFDLFSSSQSSRDTVIRFNAIVHGRRLRSHLLEKNKKSSNSTIGYVSESGTFGWGRIACVYICDDVIYALIQRFKSSSAIEALRAAIRDQTQSDHLADILKQCDSLNTIRRVSIDNDAPFISINASQIVCHGIVVALEKRIYLCRAPFFNMLT